MFKFELSGRTGILLATILVVALTLGGAFYLKGAPGQPEENLKIGDIIQNPSSYEGQTVIIEGKYGGWLYGGNMPVCAEGAQVSRSDWSIYDETGCICVSALGEVKILEAPRLLKPWDENCIGANITIKGTIKISDKNIPYIG